MWRQNESTKIFRRDKLVLISYTWIAPGQTNILHSFYVYILKARIFLILIKKEKKKKKGFVKIRENIEDLFTKFPKYMHLPGYF